MKRKLSAREKSLVAAALQLRAEALPSAAHFMLILRTLNKTQAKARKDDSLFKRLKAQASASTLSLSGHSRKRRPSEGRKGGAA
jgi:hypothetical protein